MRTVKFLVLAAAMAAATPLLAQGGLQPGAFPQVDRFARNEARRFERQQLRRRLVANRFGRMRMANRFGPRFAARNRAGVGFPAALRVGPRAGFRAGARAGFRAGNRAGFRAGARAGFRAGLHRGLRANATPEQKAFRSQLRAQRQAVRAQVKDGKLTREQAHTQLRGWITEHRPNK